MSTLFTPPPRKVRKVVAPRRSRLSVALLAAFAVGAVPAFFAPQAGAAGHVIGGGDGGNDAGAMVFPAFWLDALLRTLPPG
ncbi:MAG: hypothetical protein IIT59_00045 [Rhodocyclaceae bacterium]|nr:hypothetical protein [Rhodocyclaceae bacterium]